MALLLLLLHGHASFALLKAEPSLTVCMLGTACSPHRCWPLCVC